MTKSVTGMAPSPYEPAAAGRKSRRRLLIAIKTKKKRPALYRRLSRLRWASQPDRLMTTERFNDQASAGPCTEDNLRRIFSEENKMTHRSYKRAMAPIAAVLIICLTASAQVAQVEKVDLEMMKKIREEGMQRSQVMETLSWLTDVHGPRLTNSPQYIRAREWAKGKLTEWGLQNASLEAWGPFGRGWSLEGFTANIVKHDFIPLIA